MIETTAKKAKGTSSPFALQRRQGDDQRRDRHRHHRVDRHPLSLTVESFAETRLPKPLSREKAKHIREALVRQAAPQKSWPTTEMIRTNLPQPVPSASTSSVGAKPERFVGAVDVGDREGDRQQHDPADHRRVEDRPPDSLRAPIRRAVGLLGDVRRGVEAGDRVLGQQEAERQDVEPVHAAAEAAVVDPVAEDEAEALVAVGDEDQDQDDRRDAEHVPPDRDAVDQRQQVGAADVDRACGRARISAKRRKTSLRMWASSPKLIPKMFTS